MDDNFDKLTFRSFDANLTKNYTVENKKGIEEKRHEDDPCENFWLSVTKWLVAVLLSVTVLFCVALSKVLLFVLGQQYRDLQPREVISPRNVTNSTRAYSPPARAESRDASRESLFIMLVLVLMIPQLVSFVLAMWKSLRPHSHPWPSSKAVLLILLGGLMEVTSLCYLCLVVQTVLPVSPDVFVLLMCSVSLAPAMWQVVKMRSSWSTRGGKQQTLIFTVATACSLQGMVIFSYKVPNMAGRLGIPLALMFLSFAWSPTMRKLQTQPRKQRILNQLGKVMPRPSMANLALADLEEEQETTSPILHHRESAGGKATFILSIWKLLLTPFVALIFCKTHDIADLSKLSEGFSAINTDNPSFVFFIIQVFASFGGYILSWLACSLRMQQVAFALPLTLCTPVVFALTVVRGVCDSTLVPLKCGADESDYFTFTVGFFLWLAQFLASGYYVWKSEGFVMAKASTIFWIPSYNGALLEQNLLLNRKNQATDDGHVAQRNLSRDTYLFICTTMYHEADYEMEQLLRSLHDLDAGKEVSGRHIESHIWFDGCLRAEVLNNYVLQLASLVEDTLMVPLRACTKMKTPYGMQLRWLLPGGMHITIHLKDNTKVKNKKRWSQVMYMSYVLDYKESVLGVRDDQTFILTTDADVKFTHESVEALMDVILQDPRIGAVCGRTHPMGSGPLVWYQIFDYAIGHWFQKVSNHVFGSVLCSPGCFSLYRCQAVRCILPTYATSVDQAFEFLTKDMGEDRWMCTLMIQFGWRLTYCAAAEDSTYCPESFEEFYKQRRRWMPSTLANLVLLISQWKVMLANNESMSLFFMIYQAFLVLSTIIGPSTVTLVIVGGINFAGLGTSHMTSTVFLTIIMTVYTLICLFSPQSFQLKVAKLLTFVFAVIMCVVTIGVANQISNELEVRNVVPTLPPTVEPNTTAAVPTFGLEHELPAGISTLYLAGLAGVFGAAALLHPKEAYCLLHGIWYLLCLPSGYLLLTIYSVSNITDRSWGTREEKSKSTGSSFSVMDLLKPIWERIKKLLPCCKKLRRTSKAAPPVSADENANKPGNDGDKGSEKNAEKSVRGYVNKDETVYQSTEVISEEPENEVDDKETTDSDEDVFSEKSSRRLPSEKDDQQETTEDSESDRKTKATSVGSVLSKKDELADEDVLRADFPEPPVGLELSDSVSVANERALSNEMNSCSSASSSCVNSLADAYKEKLTSPRIPSTGFMSHVSPANLQNLGYTRRPSGENRWTSEMSLAAAEEEGRQGTAFLREISIDDITTDVEDWLEGDLKRYARNFRKNGYDNLSFLTSVTETDLKNLGVVSRGHRQKLLREIRRIPRVDIEEGVPDDVQEWLEELNLSIYWPNFETSGYTEPSDLEDLKCMSKDAIRETFKVFKAGHLNKLIMAIRKLQYPNQGQMKIRQTRREMDRLPLYHLDVNNEDEGAEYEFWEGLRQTCLLPELSGFGQTSELKEKLVELRNTTLLIFAVTNALWLIIIMTLVQHHSLKFLGVDIAGLCFLAVYGLIFVLQFVALLAHRLLTVLHILARAPWTPGSVQTKSRVCSQSNTPSTMQSEVN